MKKLISIALCLMMLTAVLAGCGKKVVSTGTTKKVTSDEQKTATTDQVGQNESGAFSGVLSGSYTDLSEVPEQDLDEITTEYQEAAPQKGDVIAVIKTNHGDIKIKFFPEVAPIAVNNFIALAKAGKFDDTIFHRITSVDTAGCEVIQAGDYTNFNGTGGESIYGENFKNEICDYTLNIRGAVAMAHSSLPDSNGSQFFINTSNNNGLDGDYTVFAQVCDGMDVVDEIHALERDSSDAPIDKVTIETVEITEYK